MHAVLLICWFLALPALAAAQSPPDSARLREATVGERVRIRFPGPGKGYYLSGTLEGIRPDSLAVRSAGKTRVLGRDQVSRIERAAGKTSAWQTGLVVGLLVGGVVGGATGAAAYKPCSPDDSWCMDFGQGAEAAAGALVGAGIGGLAGAGLGAVIGKTRWEPAVLPGAGIGARVTLR